MTTVLLILTWISRAALVGMIVFGGAYVIEAFYALTVNALHWETGETQSADDRLAWIAMGCFLVFLACAAGIVQGRL